MSEGDAVLLLHGLSMSGVSMRRILGPLDEGVRARGLDIIAPDGGHAMGADEVTQCATWMIRQFERAGRHVDTDFIRHKYWAADAHFDWFGARTTDETGSKHYTAVEASLSGIERAVRGRRVTGVIGFSQGAAMAIVVASLAAQGDPRFKDLEWGVFLSGFCPVFQEPPLVTYPIRGPLRSLCVMGDQDPIFTGGQVSLDAMASAFESVNARSLLVPGLDHDISDDPEVVERILAFIAPPT